MQKLGQHFLTDKNVLKKIASLVADGGTVIEIGPGHGELTAEIRKAHPLVRIIAVEKDAALAEKMNGMFSGDGNIEIVRGDALKDLPAIVAGLPRKNGGYAIAGNIPYYITGNLLRTIGELENKPSVTVLTIQKEVAERICSAPPKMNRLAASVQFWAEPKVEFAIPKGSFNPPPKIDSATIVLRTVAPGRKNGGSYYSAVRAVFSQPRKTILNNISSGFGIAKKECSERLSGAKISSDSRPQDLSIGDIIRISEIFRI